MSSSVCLPFCLTLLTCLIAATSQHSSNCCLKTSKQRIPKNRVVDYTVQKAGVCPIDAIVVLTGRGKTVCYSPDSDWIKIIMRTVDQNKLTKPNCAPKAPPRQKRKRKNRRGGKQKKQKGQ